MCRGKSHLLKLLQKCEDVQKAFASLKAGEISDENSQLLEGFACNMYPNSKGSTSVNESRLKHFYMAYKPQKSKTILSLKNVSSISMPPCYNALYQQILRVHLITAMWLNAYRSDMSPSYYGYNIVNGKYYPKWYEGDIVPPSIESICVDSNETGGEEGDELFYDNDEDDTDNEDTDEEL